MKSKNSTEYTIYSFRNRPKIEIIYAKILISLDRTQYALIAEPNYYFYSKNQKSFLTSLNICQIAY